MAADFAATMRNCAQFAKNLNRLRNCTNKIKLFVAQEPFQSFCIDILRSLTNSNRDRKLLLFITARFSKLPQSVPLRKIDALSVAESFAEHWVFNHGLPAEVFS